MPQDPTTFPRRPNILLQLDPDPQPSVFDSVVALDAGVDQLLRHNSVDPSAVRDLVHGAIFTRGNADLRRTAIFIGGSNVAAGEALLEAVTQAFFGSVRVSVMLDSNGANTTAVAAVLAANKHLDLATSEALVLAATGPVGQRVVRLLARQGCRIRAASRNFARAEALIEAIPIVAGRFTPWETGTATDLATAIEGVQLVIAAGAPGVELATQDVLQQSSALRVALDLNAVPPLGLSAVRVTDQAEQRDGVVCYGALGVGSLKMRIHKAAIRKLFDVNDLVLDAEEIFRLGQAICDKGK